MSGFLSATDEEDTVTKSELLAVRNGTRPIAFCEYCQEQYARKRRDQRFCSSRCAGKWNAQREYGPTGKAKIVKENETTVVEDQALVEALWLEPLPRPLQPFTDEEITFIADISGIDPAKVRAVAWLTALKLEVGP